MQLSHGAIAYISEVARDLSQSKQSFTVGRKTCCVVGLMPDIPFV